MRRLLAIALMAHGLAHASAGMWATDIGGRGLVTILWEGAAIGFIAAGLGLLGVPPFARWWGRLVGIAALSSLALLLIYNHPLFIPGIVGDFVAIALVILTKARGGRDALHAPSRITQRLLMAFMIYVAVIIALRPWYSAWGSTRSEQQMSLIGDPPLLDSHYRIDHAITIDAPVDSVWRLLVQVADSAGWRVDSIEPGRAMVVSGRGAFVLSPIDRNTTRMHIRTRGEGVPTLSGVAITPLGLLVFEPAHFIMERGMLRGIKARAERAMVSPRIGG